jgi:hypothetical protein
MTARPEQSAQEGQTTRRFPLGLCMAGIVTTGAGLAASACGLRWGAGSAQADALDVAWLYVNVAMMWTILALWPAVAMGRAADVRRGRGGLFRDFAVLAAAAIPAMAVAAFLSGVSGSTACKALAVHAGAALLAAGAMAWRGRIGPAVIAGFLGGLAMVLPMVAYAWGEFFPAAGKGWMALVPMLAIDRAAEGSAGSVIWWVAASYAVMGTMLLLLAPRAIDK